MQTSAKAKRMSTPTHLVKETLSHLQTAKEPALGSEWAKAQRCFPSDAMARLRRRSLSPALRSVPEAFPDPVDQLSCLPLQGKRRKSLSDRSPVDCKASKAH